MNDYLDQVEKIMEHKYLESEKKGYDVGEEWASMDWVTKYAGAYRMWLDNKKATNSLSLYG